MIPQIVTTRLKRSMRKLLRPVLGAPPAQLPKKRNEWSIGIYTGVSPFHLTSPEHIDNPVLTCADISDTQASLIADPFMLHVDHRWHMFFEIFSRPHRKGEIGLAISDNGVTWSYQQIVLAEPFHLSYPYIFAWMDEYYMIPESHQANDIRLYRAVQFPKQWSQVGTLLSHQKFVDASVFRYNHKWWLFAETNPEVKHDTLRLYYADDLLGPWVEHPKSPIIEGNAHIARPGGRVLILQDRIIRYTQDCYPIYGTQVRAFEITKLTTRDYHEQALNDGSILSASGRGWNGSGMHHIDPHRMEDGRWIACVDGWLSAEAANAAEFTA